MNFKVFISLILCLFFFRSCVSQSITYTYYIDVVPKTQASPFYGQGYLPQSYTISQQNVQPSTSPPWVEGGTIELIADVTRLLLMTEPLNWEGVGSGVPCATHPVYITTSVSGQGSNNSIGAVSLKLKKNLKP